MTSPTRRGRPPSSLLRDTHPALFAEIDWGHNAALGIDVESDFLGPGAKRDIWWFRVCNGVRHEWHAMVYARVKGTGCGICSGKQVMPGVNDLATRHPAVASQWHPSKNGDHAPQAVAPKSNKVAWWLCERGHEWDAIIASRSNGNGCKYCAGQAAWPGENDLATLRPDLAVEWHPTENGDLTPSDVTSQANVEVSWLCPRGHTYPMRVDRRFVGGACSVCSGRRVVPGVNDLATVHPAIAAEWHPTKNGDLTPTSIPSGHDGIVWWLGATCGHSWDAQVFSRTHPRYPSGCDICAGRRALPGFNDLATVHPAIAAEWHPTKNGDLTPEDVTAGGRRRAHWLGTHCDHDWKVAVYARTGRDKNGCPKCATSYVERALVNALRGLGLDVEHDARLPVQWGKRGTSRVDMTVTLSGGTVAVVEYDGQYWHRASHAKDEAKTIALLAAGHPVVRVREGDLGSLNLIHEHLHQVERPLREDITLTAQSIAKVLTGAA